MQPPPPPLQPTDDEEGAVISTVFPLVIKRSYEKDKNSPNFGFKVWKESSVADLRQLMTFHLKNVLLTCPEERINYPNFGVCLRQYLFEQVNNLDLEAIKHKIVSQVAEYAGFINISFINIFLSPEDHAMHIRISFFVNLNNSVNSLEDTFTLILDQSGEYETSVPT